MPGGGPEAHFPGRVTDKFVRSLSPADLTTLTKPQFERVARQMGRMERKEYERGLFGNSGSGRQSDPLLNE